MTGATAMRLGIDLGGTKMEIVALDAGGAVRFRHRIPTPRDYDATVRGLAALVAAAEAAIPPAGAVPPSLGIGIPGSVCPRTGLVRNANTTWVNGRPLDSDLAAVIGRPVRLENDANCFALAEAVSGAAQGAPTVFGVILGTGAGGGVVVDGRVLYGRNRVGGEWGHNPLPRPRDDERPGPLCFCGRHGCIDQWVSGPALMREHTAATGQVLSGAEIGAAAEAGDVAALDSLARHVDRLGRALAGVINILDPDVIVLGGGLSNIDRLLRDLPDALKPHVFSDTFDTPVRRNALGDSAGVIGAAWLWPSPQDGPRSLPQEDLP